MGKTFAIILGSILALLGLLGFISNPLIGANALFTANAAHNILHLILGAILLVVAFCFSRNSVLWLKIIGAIVFLLGLVGVLAVPSVDGLLLGFLYTNGASNWLHLIAGVVMFVAGLFGKDDSNPVLSAIA